jgi:HSP20 family protein
MAGSGKSGEKYKAFLVDSWRIHVDAPAQNAGHLLETPRDRFERRGITRDKETVMASLSRRESIFQDLFDFRRDFDRMFNRFFTASPGPSDQGRHESRMLSFAPAVESYLDREGKKFVTRVALPDLDPKDVNIQVQGNELCISGERKINNERKGADFVQSEIMYGYFERDIPLPEGIDKDKINAEYHNGVLEITAPVSAAALPKRIEVKSKEGTKQIGASAGSR